MISIRPFTLLLAALLLFSGGCKTIPDAHAEEGRNSPAASAKDEPISSAQLQQKIMDFSDHYVSALWLALDDYIANEPDAAKQVKAQKWKIMLGATSMTIAASKDPRSGLLDMAVFISAGKWAVDHDWIPEVFGEKAASLRALYKEMDRKIWNEVALVLTPAQQSDLRDLIAAWEASDPPRNQLLDVRLRNLDGVVLRHFAEAPSTKGLLAGIQRVLGTVDQSLLYGERMIFYMERMPRMLSMQSDLTIDRVAEKFPIATIDPDFSSLDAFARDLPSRIDAALQDQESLLSRALPEIRSSIDSIGKLTLSLQQTVDSANLLSSRIEKLPFEREDYLLALRETSTALTQLNGLVGGLNQLVDGGPEDQPRALQLAQVLDQRTDLILDKAFHRALILIAVFFAGVLASLILAKLLFRQRQPRDPQNP